MPFLTSDFGLIRTHGRAFAGLFICFFLVGPSGVDLPSFLRAGLPQSVIIVDIFGWLGSGFIDNAAHGGGFAGGILLAMATDRFFRLGAKTVGPITRLFSWNSPVVLAFAALKVAREWWKIYPAR